MADQHPSQAQSTIEPYYCIDCAEQHQDTPIRIGSYKICESSFRERMVPQFEQALKNEAEHPVKIDGVPLDITDYYDFFSKSFLRRWQKKQEEYNTPIQKRMYCACGEFLGHKINVVAAAYVVVHCPVCRAVTCSKCCKPSSDTGLHVCETAEKKDAFEKMKRGEDYQICPNVSCQVKITLADGCNHMRCPFCNTDLCFICGARATDGSGHWTIGKPCPRFGKKTSPRAIYDHQHPIPALPFQRRLAQRLVLTPEEERILATPAGQLYLQDSDTLNNIHDRVLFLEMTTTQQTVAHDRIRLVHHLVHRLEVEIEVYVADLREVRTFREEEGHRQANERIESFVGQIGEERMGEFEGLGEIVEAYREAWEGRVEGVVAERGVGGGERTDTNW